MVSKNEIIAAIENAVTEKIPELESIYINSLPKDFIRPCILIETVKMSSKSTNKRTVEVNAHFTLTIFGAEDSAENADTTELTAMQEKVLGIFDYGYLSVESAGERRCLNIAESTGRSDFYRAYADIHFEYLDDRNIKEENYPLIEEINTSFKQKG